MCQIKLEIIEDKIKVTTPYNDKFVQKARNLRGSWKGGAWWFDDSLLDYVREIMVEIYGTSGEVPYETCTLIISNYSDSELCAPVSLFGRTIARAWDRDGGAKLGDDIIFLKGEYTSGGSVKYWKTVVNDATFEMKKIPVPSLELPEIKQAIEEGWCVVKQEKSKRKREDIEAEIEVFKNKIIELEKELAL